MNAHTIRSRHDVEADAFWRISDDDSLQAFAAACVLVAQADGWVTPAERRRTIGRMRPGPVLGSFSHDELALAFEQLNRRLDYDFEEGTRVAEAAVRRISDRTDAARLVIEAACAVAEADGGLDGEEREVILRLCELLSLNPADFDLVASSGRRI